MGIRANFGSISGKGVYEEQTIRWLYETGLIGSIYEDELKNVGFVDIELRDTPSVLSYFSQLENELNISRITPAGIVFYLTDIPLWLNIPEEKQRATTENYDGYLFVPMSNVICINSLGAVIPKDVGDLK